MRPSPKHHHNHNPWVELERLGDSDALERPRAGWFQRIAASASEHVGTSWAFLIALSTIAVWALTGPMFRFSDTWQLVINTGTTIVTFLMVFLIQNTQNRDARAIHLKLDELLRAQKGARTSFADLETRSDSEMEKLRTEFSRLARVHTPAAPVGGPAPKVTEPPDAHQASGLNRKSQ